MLFGGAGGQFSSRLTLGMGSFNVYGSKWDEGAALRLLRCKLAIPTMLRPDMNNAMASTHAHEVSHRSVSAHCRTEWPTSIELVKWW